MARDVACGGRRARGLRAACAALALAWLATAPASAAPIALSVELDGTVLGGTTYDAGDVVLYDPVAGTASLLLPSTVFNTDTLVDSLDVLDDGRIVLSTSQSNRTIGGITVRDGDVAVYDPLTDTAVLLFSEDTFTDNADIDAVDVLSNGHLVFSVSQSEQIGGLSFGDGDIVEYDPLTGTTTLIFSESLFGGNEDVDGVWVAPDGSIYLSTATSATLGGVSFGANDVMRWDPLTSTATLAFDGSLLPPGTRAVAVYFDAPAPPAAAMLVSGLIGLLLFPHLRRRRGQAPASPVRGRRLPRRIAVGNGCATDGARARRARGFVRPPTFAGAQRWLARRLPAEERAPRGCSPRSTRLRSSFQKRARRRRGRHPACPEHRADCGTSCSPWRSPGSGSRPALRMPSCGACRRTARSSGA